MSFIHATFLAAGLGIAIPWLIHLTRKRKYLRIKLGSLQFLDPIVKDRHRMSKVEQWPLLIARCIVILLLALVFARPFFPKPSPTAPTAGETILLLDASGSISADQANTIRKQAAKTLAALSQATRPLLVTVTDQVTIIPSLEAYQPIPGSAGDFARAVDWITDRASTSTDALVGVHWFTDLQRGSLPAAPSRLWPSGLPVEIHPTLPQTDRNVSLGPIELLTPFGGEKWEIESQVQIHGVAGNRQLELVLTTTDGVQIAATAPADGGKVRFQWDGEAVDGILAGTIALKNADDAWAGDDQRAFAFRTNPSKSIILVDGDPGDSPFLSETYFLEKALHASAAGKTLSPFRATITTTLPAPQDKVDVIALCNVRGISAADARSLRAHLDRGVGLAIFLGDLTEATSWNSAATEGIIPTGLQTLSSPAPAFVRRSELTHPALSGLTLESARALGLTALTRRFSWPADPKWINVLTFDDDSALAAASATERIAIFTHPVNRQGSDLPLAPAFVPLMQGLFSHLGRSTTVAAGEIPIEQTAPGQLEKRAPGLYARNPGFTVVTADSEESNIASTNEKTFRNQLGLPALNASPPEASPVTLDVSSNHQREGELWPWILAALLALLTVESVFAARSIKKTVPP